MSYQKIGVEIIDILVMDIIQRKNNLVDRRSAYTEQAAYYEMERMIKGIQALEHIALTIISKKTEVNHADLEVAINSIKEYVAE